MMEVMQMSLYIHFPFCLRKCLYCDFNSLAGSAVTPEEYVRVVVKEMELRAARLNVPSTATTLYLGGGTPSLMEPGLVARLLDAAKRCYGLKEDAEVTIEANPGTVTMTKLEGYREAGVNRLSLGVQSFNDAMLARLGRVHTAREVFDSFAAGRAAGFDNISLDLIHSLPGQTPALWLEELIQAVRLQPEHVSAYGLSIEEGTPFHVLAKEGGLALPEEEEELRMFQDTSIFLGEAGYKHYEISSFARPGYYSRHNQVYWRRGNCLAFGAGAHSFLDTPGFGVRWRNALSPEGYAATVLSSALPDEDLTLLSERDAMAEYFFLGLRMQEGVDLGLFCRRFGQSVEEAFPGELPKLFAEKLVERRECFLRLTAAGLLISNQVFMRFIQ